MIQTYFQIKRVSLTKANKKVKTNKIYVLQWPQSLDLNSTENLKSLPAQTWEYKGAHCVLQGGTIRESHTLLKITGDSLMLFSPEQAPQNIYCCMLHYYNIYLFKIFLKILFMSGANNYSAHCACVPMCRYTLLMCPRHASRWWPSPCSETILIIPTILRPQYEWQATGKEALVAKMLANTTVTPC